MVGPNAIGVVDIEYYHRQIHCNQCHYPQIGVWYYHDHDEHCCVGGYALGILEGHPLGAQMRIVQDGMLWHPCEANLNWQRNYSHPIGV